MFVLWGGNFTRRYGGGTFLCGAAGMISEHLALWIDPEESARILLGTVMVV